MPPKIGVTKLAMVQPVPEELKEAKKLLSDDSKKARSKMACMVSWLKNNPDKDVLESRGEKRQEYLMAFLVHQMRSKSSDKVVENSRVITTHEDKRADLYWWSQEKMDAEIGAS